MVFPAKVDLWFSLVFYGAGLAMLFGAPFAWKRTTGSVLKRGPLGAILLGFLGVLFVAVPSHVSSVRYVLTGDGYLDAQGGWPFAGRITSIAAIRSVEPSRDPRSSHAASFDRLRIDYGPDGRIFIAVHDKPAFFDALVRRDPGLIRTETGVRREEPTAGR